MVLLQISRSNTDPFICELPVSSTIEYATQLACQIYNYRIQIRSALFHLNELIKEGPVKGTKDGEGEEKGKEENNKNNHNNNPQSNDDDEEEKIPSSTPSLPPLPPREGPSFSPTGEYKEVLLKSSLESASILSETLVKQRKPILLEQCETALQTIKTAVKIVYPLGLPSNDPLRICLEYKMDENINPSSSSPSPSHPFPFPPSFPSFLPPSDSQLWFAGKRLDVHEKVSKYSGNNEKSLLKCQLERLSSQSQPSRDQGVDEETQKKMMAFYYKKEKENRELSEESEDSYLNSEWANPKGYKQQMMGMGNVSFKMK